MKVTREIRTSKSKEDPVVNAIEKQIFYSTMYNLGGHIFIIFTSLAIYYNFLFMLGMRNFEIDMLNLSARILGFFVGTWLGTGLVFYCYNKVRDR